MNEQFSQQVFRELQSGRNASALRDLLVAFKDAGGSQGEAYKQIESLRPLCNEQEEDLVLELLDIVSGFCGPEHRVWTTDDIGRQS